MIGVFHCVFLSKATFMWQYNHVHARLKGTLSVLFSLVYVFAGASVCNSMLTLVNCSCQWRVPRLVTPLCLRLCSADCLKL